METIKSARTTDLDRSRKHGQEGFSLTWWVGSILVQTVLTAAFVVGLPMAVGQLDFEGSYGMTVCIPIWFFGGLLVGMISPGKTFLEPMLATFLVAIPTVFYLAKTQTVRTMPVFMYVILALIGLLFTLIGSYMGERIQMGPPPKPSE